MVRLHSCTRKRASALLVSGWLLGLLLALAGAAFAQTDVTTSRISGTVKGSDGAPLPGVSVEALNQEIGKAGAWVLRPDRGAPVRPAWLRSPAVTRRSARHRPGSPGSS